MDAAHTLLKKTVLLLALALFAVAPVIQAQTLSSSATAVTLQGTTGAQVNVTSSDSTTVITFTRSIAYGDNASLNWLSVAGGSTTPTTLFVNLGGLAGSLPAGTHTATVTLTATSPASTVSFTVSYTVGSSGGGGGQTGTITAAPSSVPLSALSGNTTSTQVTLSTGSPTAITFTVGFDQFWLSGFVTSNTVFSGTTATLTVIGSAVGLSNNTYTGHVTITPTVGAVTTIPVTFTVGTGGTGSGTLTATPNTINFAYTSNSGSFPSQFVVLQSSAGAATYTANATSSTNWLLVNGGTSGVSGAVTNGLTASVSGAITALATGTYQGQILVTDSSGGTANITVNLTVNGGATTGLTFSPSTGVTFSAAVGGGTPPVQQVFVTSQVSGGLTVGCTSSGWLLCSGNPGAINQNSAVAITLTATPGSLASGTYFGTLTVTVTGTSNLTGSVPITFIVGSGSGGSGGSTSLSVAPASLVFTYQTGTNINFVSRQTVAITGPTGSPWLGTVSTVDGGGWLALSTIQGNLSDGTGATTVIINPTGLALGTYSGTVTINVTGTGTTQSVAVSLSVVAGAILLSTPGSLVFNFHTGDTLQPQGLFLAASDGSALSITAATATPWITVSQTAGSGSIGVSVNPAGMATGLYSGSVTVTQSGLANSPLTIPVVLIINAGSGGGGGSGLLTLNPASMTFSAAAGVSPASQTLSVTASTTTNFSVGVTTANGVNWLTLGQSGGVTPANILVIVNSTSLTVGTYTGSITFTANGVNQTVSVILNVTTTGGGGGNVTATPASLSFSGQAGAGNLAGQTLSISSTQGAAGVNVTLTASGGSWLTTSLQSGATPFSVTVNVNVAGLSAGTYNASIIITPSGGNVVTVPVTLTVTALPAVSATPTSLTFAFRAGDPVPASQPVSVTGGGSSLSFTATASSNGNWLAVSPASGTTPATVNVSVNPSGLAASTTPYAGTITVSGSGNATGSTTVSVSLTVTAPLPTVTGLTNAGSFVSGSISPGEIITLFGTNIGPSTAAGLALDTTGKVSTTIGGVQVLVSGFACPMVFANATQVSAVVPYEIAGFVSADVFVRFAGVASNAIHVNVATTAPGLFTANSSGKGPGAILNGNNSFNSPNNPAAKGEIVALYMTGEGQTSPRGVTGKVTTVSTTPPLTPGPLLPVSVLIGPAGAQQPANFTFAGEAPGLISGAMQLNVQIPLTAASGDQQIVVSIGGNPSQTGVTVSVR
jgi:uncharacterized protein (TIGR03437 family)